MGEARLGSTPGELPKRSFRLEREVDRSEFTDNVKAAAGWQPRSRIERLREVCVSRTRMPIDSRLEGATDAQIDIPELRA